MMKNYLIVLLCFVHWVGLAQVQPKTITYKGEKVFVYPYPSSESGIFPTIDSLPDGKYVSYVSKSFSLEKKGEYRPFDPNDFLDTNTVAVEFNIQNGKKNGLVVYYPEVFFYNKYNEKQAFNNEMATHIKGYYKENVPVMTWKYYAGDKILAEVGLNEYGYREKYVKYYRDGHPEMIRIYLKGNPQTDSLFNFSNELIQVKNYLDTTHIENLKYSYKDQNHISVFELPELSNMEGRGKENGWQYWFKNGELVLSQYLKDGHEAFRGCLSCKENIFDGYGYLKKQTHYYRKDGMDYVREKTFDHEKNIIKDELAIYAGAYDYNSLNEKWLPIRSWQKLNYNIIDTCLYRIDSVQQFGGKVELHSNVYYHSQYRNGKPLAIFRQDTSAYSSCLELFDHKGRLRFKSVSDSIIFDSLYDHKGKLIQNVITTWDLHNIQNIFVKKRRVRGKIKLSNFEYYGFKQAKYFTDFHNMPKGIDFKNLRKSSNSTFIGKLKNGRLNGEWIGDGNSYYDKLVENYQYGVRQGKSYELGGLGYLGRGQAVKMLYGKSVKRELEYHNGKLNGTVTHYYFNGNLSNLSLYKEGELVEEMRFYRHGSIQSKTSFSDSLIKETRYYGDGNLLSESCFKNDRFKQGDKTYIGYQKEWNDSNQLVSISKYDSMGVLLMAKEYFGSGQIKHHSKLVSDSLTGKVYLIKNYHPNGQIASEGLQRKTENPFRGIAYVKTNFDHGLWNYYNESGQLIKRINYYPVQMDTLVDGNDTLFVSNYGFYESWYGNGQLQTRGLVTQEDASFDCTQESLVKLQNVQYIDHFSPEGIQEVKNGTGKLIAYHPNGVVSINASLKSGKYEGVYLAYDQNGSLIEQGAYKDGVADGRWLKGNLEGQYNAYQCDISQEDLSPIYIDELFYRNGQLIYAMDYYWERQ